MTDVFDQATRLEEQERELILACRRLASLQQANLASLGSAQECHCCGDPIPPARRRAAPGCTRCVACESENERQRKLRTR
ncbi:TraR/DksA C4-type zinc finger protein [Massilia sp. NR 4-1]|uniref:TraR/DksA C4-type zinc finger protein n=1 Tax=Massilia sp. NR 4-1 TaxID=1678028 RepID=UPI0006A2AC06|nr:TraR/DksA C4-type zinc finger protein [Massilia sp. NR 4-1]AKU21888.1 hypothetical protein ACZ75_10830 [Massilia sp. NR 4-1]